MAEVKAILSYEIAPLISAAEIDEQDGQGEILNWLAQMANLAGLTAG